MDLFIYNSDRNALVISHYVFTLRKRTKCVRFWIFQIHVVFNEVLRQKQEHTGKEHNSIPKMADVNN